MMKAVCTTRFAPSPTGYLHLGNLRTALFSALYARHQNGRFVLRSEDTDAARSREQFLAAIEEDLEWLGLCWDAGPHKSDARGPYRQSERSGIYAGFFDQLVSAGKAYPCFCSAEELERSRRASIRRGKPPRYEGTCRHLDQAEIDQKISRGMSPSLRFRIADQGTIAFHDLVKGDQLFALTDIGDFVIRRSDGTPAFLYSNAIDDALMGVTHVLRGEDHLANTPRQLTLLAALGLPEPAYGHLSLIVGDDGKPLSKRHGAGDLRSLRSQGYLPIAILNHLFRLGHACDSGELLTIGQMADRFSPDHLGRAPARHDRVQLDHWQKLGVMRLDDEALMDWMRGSGENHAYLESIPDPLRASFLELVRENLQTPDDAMLWAKVLFTDTSVCSDDVRSGLQKTAPAFFEKAVALWAEGYGDFSEFAGALSLQTGTKGRQLFMPLRLALSGQAHGPELVRIVHLLGRDRVEMRFKQAVEYCGG